MRAIDTNVFVRYLTGDHPTQSPRARVIIEGGAVFAPVTVVLEAEWVLRSAYEYRSVDVIDALRAFAGLPTVTVEDEALVAAALDLAGNGMDFADALHLCRSSHRESFVTFDRKLVKAARALSNAMVSGV